MEAMKYIVANLGVHLHSLPKTLISGKKWTSLQATLRIPVYENCFQSPCWHARKKKTKKQYNIRPPLHRSSTSSMLLLFILFHYSFKTLWNYTIQNRCDLGPVFRTAAFALCDELIHGLQRGSLHVEDTFALWPFLVACFPASQSFLEYNYTNYTPKTYPNSQLPRFLPYIPRLVHDFHWHHARCALFPPDFPAPGSALPLRKQIHEKLSLRPTCLFYFTQDLETNRSHESHQHHESWTCHFLVFNIICKKSSQHDQHIWTTKPLVLPDKSITISADIWFSFMFISTFSYQLSLAEPRFPF